MKLQPHHFRQEPKPKREDFIYHLGTHDWDEDDYQEALQEWERKQYRDMNKEAPERIYLQWVNSLSNDNSFCEDKINDSDVEYIRKDAADKDKEDLIESLKEVTGIISSLKLCGAASLMGETENKEYERSLSLLSKHKQQ